MSLCIKVMLIFCVLSLYTSTALSDKSDSDVMFVYKVIRDLISIDHLCINPIIRIGLIHK